MVYAQAFKEGQYNWKVMTLTPEEVKEVEGAHRALSISIMKECLKDAWNINSESCELWSQVTQALFESRMPKLYTMMVNRLNDKIMAYKSKDYITQSLGFIKKERIRRG